MINYFLIIVIDSSFHSFETDNNLDVLSIVIILYASLEEGLKCVDDLDDLIFSFTAQFSSIITNYFCQLKKMAPLIMIKKCIITELILHKYSPL